MATPSESEKQFEYMMRLDAIAAELRAHRTMLKELAPALVEDAARIGRMVAKLRDFIKAHREGREARADGKLESG